MVTRNTIPLEKISANGVQRPTRGNAAIVWQIADTLALKSKPEAPERAKVLAACAAKNIAESTASNQFQKWRQFFGFGPKAPAKPKARKNTPEVIARRRAARISERH